ncbi:hypothetical protein [Gemmatimonas sp.]|nr:hypothetical protein [Gemmatimonas sp.]
MSDRELFTVEVDGFQSEHRRIDVCDATGVLQFVDYGNETLDEARHA